MSSLTCKRRRPLELEPLPHSSNLPSHNLEISAATVAKRLKIDDKCVVDQANIIELSAVNLRSQKVAFTRLSPSPSTSTSSRARTLSPDPVHGNYFSETGGTIKRRKLIMGDNHQCHRKLLSQLPLGMSLGDEKKIFTMTETAYYVRQKLKAQEINLKQEYDRMLQEKMNDLYASFIVFNRAQWGSDETPNNCIS